jgi:hypothetical protein
MKVDKNSQPVFENARSLENIFPKGHSIVFLSMTLSSWSASASFEPNRDGEAADRPRYKSNVKNGRSFRRSSHHFFYTTCEK